MPVIYHVKDWAPFNVDAVGLVTLLGANTLQKCLGRLVHHPWGECLPLLAGHIVPDDLLFEVVPGFTLYNITDGIKQDGVNAWFSRWVLSQELSTESTILKIAAVAQRKKTQVWEAVSIGLGTALHAFLIVFCVLIGDWYALAASISLTLSTLTRVVVLASSRATLDHILKKNDLSTVPVKVILRTPSNRTVTIHTTRGIVIKCLIGEIGPRNERMYETLRSTGWVAFGVFIVALGNACLAIQVITAVLLIASTFLVIKKIGCNDNLVGNYLHIEQHTIAGQGTHKRTYAALQLNTIEEDAMVEWSLFPLRSNKEWWNGYYEFSQQYMQSPSVAKMIGPGLDAAVL